MDVVVRATGKAAWNLRSDSSVVGRPTRAEFCSQGFNERLNLVTRGLVVEKAQRSHG